MPDPSPRSTTPRRTSISRGVGIVGIIPAGLLLMMAGFIALFFDDATEYEIITYWIGLLIACIAIGITMLNAHIGLTVSLALLVPCAMLADAFHGTPSRIFGMPAFPLTCIALILIVTNTVAIIVEHQPSP